MTGEHRIVERIYAAKPGTDRLLDALRFLYEDSLAREAAERLRLEVNDRTIATTTARGDGPSGTG